VGLVGSGKDGLEFPPLTADLHYFLIRSYLFVLSSLELPDFILVFIDPLLLLFVENDLFFKLGVNLLKALQLSQLLPLYILLML
jgi:hypothetical protein